MGQERIWEYFQNEGIGSFADALPRYKFLAKRAGLALPVRARVLNIGAGSGRLEVFLKDRGFLVSSLDPSEAAIERLRRAGIDGHVGRAESLPFDAGVFDAVIASEVLEHLEPRQCELAIAEARRVLNERGIFIGTVPFRESLEGSQTICPECGHRFHRWGHQQSFDHDRLERYLGVHFCVTRLSTRAFVAWRGGPRRIAKSLGKWLLARLGEHIADPHIYFECRVPG